MPRWMASGWPREARRVVTSTATREALATNLRARLAGMGARLGRCRALPGVLRVAQRNLPRLRVPLGAEESSAFMEAVCVG